MPLGRRFNVPDFLARLNAGEFDRRITEEIEALSDEQVEELGLLLVEHHKKAGHFFTLTGRHPLRGIHSALVSLARKV